MQQKNRNEFKPNYKTKFGLAITKVDKDEKVIEVVCCFCLAFGKNKWDAPKFKKMKKSCKVFSTFRPDNIQRHMETHHLEKWIKYQNLSTIEQNDFFEDIAFPEICVEEDPSEKRSVYEFPVSPKEEIDDMVLQAKLRNEVGREEAVVLNEEKPVFRWNPSDSWRCNLKKSGGGFWGNAYWYDVQVERKMPLVSKMLDEIVAALPPIGDDMRVVDVGAGSGQLAKKIVMAYPLGEMILLDQSKERLDMAKCALEKMGCKVKCIVSRVDTKVDTVLESGFVHLITSSLSMHTIVENPTHYGGQADNTDQDSVDKRYTKLFKIMFESLLPGGHMIVGDHVGLLPLYLQLKCIQNAGFDDVDIAWCNQGYAVFGGKKPLVV